MGISLGRGIQNADHAHSLKTTLFHDVTLMNQKSHLRYLPISLPRKLSRSLHSGIFVTLDLFTASIIHPDSTRAE